MVDHVVVETIAVAITAIIETIATMIVTIEIIETITIAIIETIDMIRIIIQTIHKKDSLRAVVDQTAVGDGPMDIADVDVVDKGK